MLDRRRESRRARLRRVTLGADRAYDVRSFVGGLRAQDHAAHRHRRPCPDHRQAAPDRHRQAHHPASGLRREPAPAQANRRGLRLDQDQRQPRQDPPPGPRTRRLDLHPHRGRLQPRAHTQAARRNMVAPGRREHHPTEQAEPKPLAHRTKSPDHTENPAIRTILQQPDRRTSTSYAPSAPRNGIVPVSACSALRATALVAGPREDPPTLCGAGRVLDIGSGSDRCATFSPPTSQRVVV